MAGACPGHKGVSMKIKSYKFEVWKHGVTIRKGLLCKPNDGERKESQEYTIPKDCTKFYIIKFDELQEVIIAFK